MDERYRLGPTQISTQHSKHAAVGPPNARRRDDHCIVYGYSCTLDSLRVQVQHCLTLRRCGAIEELWRFDRLRRTVPQQNLLLTGFSLARTSHSGLAKVTGSFQSSSVQAAVLRTTNAEPRPRDVFGCGAGRAGITPTGLISSVNQLSFHPLRREVYA